MKPAGIKRSISYPSLGASTVRSTRDKEDRSTEDPIKYRPLSTWHKLHIVKNNKCTCNNKKPDVHCPNKEIRVMQVSWPSEDERMRMVVVPNGISSSSIS